MNHVAHSTFGKNNGWEEEQPEDGYIKNKDGSYTKINDNGGDEIDYLYDENGKVIESTEVSHSTMLVDRASLDMGWGRIRTYGINQEIALQGHALQDMTAEFIPIGRGLKIGKSALQFGLNSVGRSVGYQGIKGGFY